MIMNEFNGKNVLITGAASGIGKEYAFDFVKKGANVILADLDVEKLDQLVEEIGIQAISVKLDVSNKSDWKNAVEKAHESFGHISILINNAGIADQTPFEYITEEGFRKSFEVNAMSIFYGCKAVYNDMVENKWGRIINVSSIAGLMASGDNPAYVTSKHAVTGFTKSCAHGFAQKGILINSIHPGAVDTPMMANLKEKYPEAIAMIINSIPVGRMADPKEIVSLVEFLASETNTFVNGANIVIDGGQYA